MTSEEFWDLTWEEYYARDDRHNEEQRRWDERFGLIASVYINTKLKEGAEQVRPGQFFGYDDAAEVEDREMTPEETLSHVVQMMQPKR